VWGCGGEAGQQNAARGSACFAGQRSIFAVLTFGSFCQEKEHQFAVEGCLRHFAFRIARNLNTRNDEIEKKIINEDPTRITNYYFRSG
jgi:hypothetical protein